MENKYSGIVFIPRTTGEAIINAYSMNAWNDTGKYIYFTEAGISVGVHTTDDGIHKFIYGCSYMCCMAKWGNISY